MGDIPGSWKVYGALGSLLESYPPILVPIRLHGAEFWPGLELNKVFR